MNDTWAGVLAISVAVMALVQVAVLIGVSMAARRLMAVAQSTQRQVEALAEDLKSRVAMVSERMNAVTDRVNAVADDVRGVTSRVQQVASTVSDGVQRVEQSVRTAGQRVAHTIDQVPPPVKRGVPVALAVIAALRTIQQVRSRMRERKNGRYAEADMYASMHG